MAIQSQSRKRKLYQNNTVELYSPCNATNSGSISVTVEEQQSRFQSAESDTALVRIQLSSILETFGLKMRSSSIDLSRQTLLILLFSKPLLFSVEVIKKEPTI